MARLKVTITGCYDLPEENLREWYNVSTFEEAAKVDEESFNASPLDALYAIEDDGMTITVEIVDG